MTLTMQFKQLGVQTDVGVWDDSQGTKARLYALSQKAKRLKGRGKKLPKGFQMDCFDPEKVGLDQEASDFYTPEALVALFAHPCKTVDWDRLEELNSINYFWEGE
jgi:hypothetical protein